MTENRLPIGYPTPLPDASKAPSPLFFQGIFGTAAAFILFYTVCMIVSGQGAMNWDLVKGQITQSVIAFNRDSDGKLTSYPSISYFYRVNGREYTSNNLRPQFNDNAVFMNGALQTQMTLNRYPMNDNVVVHVDPKNGANSCLEPGVNMQNLVLLAVFFMLFAFVPLQPFLSKMLSAYDGRNKFVR